MRILFVFVYNCEKSLWKDTQETNKFPLRIEVGKGIGNRTNKCRSGIKTFHCNTFYTLIFF